MQKNCEAIKHQLYFLFSIPCFLSSPPAGACDQTQASLREENDSLRWQLDAYRNEVELLRKEQSKSSRADDDHTHTHGPEAQIQLLQQSMHNMQQVGSSSSSPVHHVAEPSGDWTGQNVLVTHLTLRYNVPYLGTSL